VLPGFGPSLSLQRAKRGAGLQRHLPQQVVDFLMPPQAANPELVSQVRGSGIRAEATDMQAHTPGGGGAEHLQL
jgi:hypothetical protein